MTLPLPLDRPIQVGLIGFGLAGQVFHAPLIARTKGMRLGAIATTQLEAAQAAYPECRIAPDASALFEAPDIDLFVVATPNLSHVPLARSALQAGKSVVIDKPMGVSLAECVGVAEQAESLGLLLSVFHNRRWDDDFLTLRDLIARGVLGEVASFESRFDRFRPVVQDRWRERPEPASGLWWDLGPHLLDQALSLFGRPATLTAQLAIQRPGGAVDDYFRVVLEYPNRQVILGGGSLVPDPPFRFSAQGDKGAFLTRGLDPQENLLRQQTGFSPAPSGPERKGRLTLAAQEGLAQTDTPLLQGRWDLYYAGVRQALQGQGPCPVPMAEALDVMRGLEVAEESRRAGRRISWPGSA